MRITLDRNQKMLQVRKVDFWLHIIDTINEWTGKTVSFLIFPLMAVVLFEILMRYFLHESQNWEPELSAFLFATLFLLGAGYDFLHNTFVKVDVLYLRFTNKTKAIIDITTSILIFFFCGVLVWKGWAMTYKSLITMERSQSSWGPLLFPIELMIPIGAALLFLQALVKLTRDILTLTGRSK